MGMPLMDAVAAYTTGVDALLNAEVDSPSHRDLLTCFDAIQTASQRVPMTGYAILARLDREADPKQLGATSLWQLLTLRTRMSKGAALKSIARARLLGPKRTPQGQDLPPEWEHTAAGLAAGLFGDEHVEVVRKFFKALPATIDPVTRGQAERSLASAAAELDPHSLTIAAIHLLALLHPDGDEPADAAARKAGLTLGPQQPDGLSHLSGWISAKTRALLEPVLARFAERNRHPKTPSPASDDTPPEQAPTAQDTLPFTEEREPQPKPVSDELPVDTDALTADDEPADDVAGEGDPFATHPDDPPLPQPEPLLDLQFRTKAQYTHDAFATALEMLLRSRTLGTLNGLPTTVVVTTTLQELQAGAGYAVTGGGTRLPMRDLIAMAARGAHHYLAVFDEHTSETLHLGRAKRCATAAQKLALFGRERGCSAPGCTAPFYDCQAHHGVEDWKLNGQTNIDDLTLACGPNNQLIEDTEWTTRRGPDGRFQWIPPPHLDTGQPRTNNLHHPERLLKPNDEDDDPL
ncbi:HNH endonuclease signature motif containing protein [Mycolicibacterium gadium]|uniref:HNH endonuclease signature motif containing protein n=1 Tax=Mycolicibacterium gadium TaxID=1794 RepID=UPI002FDCB14D